MPDKKETEIVQNPDGSQTIKLGTDAVVTGGLPVGLPKEKEEDQEE